MRVGNYELLARLGEGGMGVVHLARAADGRRVALKVIRPNVVADDESRTRLAREVNSLSRVRSHRVAEVIDADPWGPVPYVATRYVPGGSLHALVAEQGPLDVADLMWTAGCLAEALTAVHQAGVLHRDVKPSNVLMEGRSPVLIDFGLARVAEDSQITATGWLLGTPGYIPPEVLRGEQASEASDVHSWAATVAYAATGRAPYGGGPHAAVFERVRRGEHDLVGVPDEIRDLLEAALDPEPRNRPTLTAILTWLDDEDDTFAVYDPDFADAPATAVLEVPETRPVSLEAWDRPVEYATLVQPRELWPDEAHPLGPPPDEPHPVDPQRRSPWAQAPVHGPDPVPGATPVQEIAGVQWEPAGQEAPVEWAERARRGVLSLSLALPCAAAASVAPWITAITVAVVIWLLRAGAGSHAARERRRATRGVRWYDGVQSTLGWPFHVLAAVPGTVLMLLWGACFVLATVLLAFAFAVDVPLAAAASTGAGVLGMWVGPGAGRLRRPVRGAVRPLAARPVSWVLALVLVGGTSWLLASQTLLPGATGNVDWSPASSAPWDR